MTYPGYGCNYIDKPWQRCCSRRSCCRDISSIADPGNSIQKLPGHTDIKTTLSYLHVTNMDMLNILSPVEYIKDFL